MEETGVPGGNHRPTAWNWWNFSHDRHTHTYIQHTCTHVYIHRSVYVSLHHQQNNPTTTITPTSVITPVDAVSAIPQALSVGVCLRHGGCGQSSHQSLMGQSPHPSTRYEQLHLSGTIFRTIHRFPLRIDRGGWALSMITKSELSSMLFDGLWVCAGVFGPPTVPNLPAIHGVAIIIQTAGTLHDNLWLGVPCRTYISVDVWQSSGSVESVICLRCTSTWHCFSLIDL